MHDNPYTGGTDLTIGTIYYDFTVNSLQYEIVKTGSSSPDLVKIEPSIKPCGALKQVIKSKTITLSCVEKISRKPASGCSVSVSLMPGPDDGGHGSQPHPIRPLQFANRIQDGSTLSIPSSGLQLVYESPEPSGDVILRMLGKDPNGNPLNINDTIFEVGINQQLIDISGISGFYFDLANMSHQEGIYGTSTLMQKLSGAIVDYKKAMAMPNVKLPVPLIESEGANLPRGGIFDYQNTWSPPHCTHRNGKVIDISFSPFNSMGYTKAQKAIARGLFLRSMARKRLNRNNESTTHWHFYER